MQGQGWFWSCVGFWRGFLFESYLKINPNVMTLKIKDFSLRTSGKPENVFKYMVSAGELISIWEHQSWIFAFEAWWRALGLQNSGRGFCLGFKIWLLNLTVHQLHVYKFERYFGERTLTRSLPLVIFTNSNPGGHHFWRCYFRVWRKGWVFHC